MTNLNAIFAFLAQAIAPVADQFSLDGVLQILLGSTGAVAAMVLGIRWLNADRDKLNALLTSEREARIRALEEAARQCAEDRSAMHTEMGVLQAEVRELYRRIAEIISGSDEPITKIERVALLSSARRPDA